MDEPKDTTTGLSISNNGLSPDMDDEELLQELTAGLIKPSYGLVRLKSTHGEKISYRKIRIKPIDIIRLQQETENLTPDQKASVMQASADIKSEGFSEDVWLQSLVACVLALDQPHVLKKSNGETVWNPAGKPQEMFDAILVFLSIGLDYWHIDQISKQSIQLTKDIGQSEGRFLGNS